MTAPAPLLLLARAVDYFDRMTGAGQFAGCPSLALVHTAQKFNLTRNDLAAAIRKRRDEEKLTAA